MNSEVADHVNAVRRFGNFGGDCPVLKTGRKVTD